MRVLVVEDEQRLAKSIALGLEDHGFAVDVDHHGQTGFDKARFGDYDAIVLDIMLPGLNGYEIARRLRSEEVWTPILMLTAKDGEYDEADALDLGADDYLRKPFSFVVLVARLNALLRRDATARPAQLQVGELVLDPGKRTARRGEVELGLTPRELSLLEYLMRNAGQTLSKIELLDHVWSDGIDVDPNTVEVYIGYLRRKVDRPFDVPMIHTVRGHGYRLEPADG
ncbi:MAG TPA: response regulator transcription factor [Nitriliruptorales bacterium]|nr:response regulator transcription factor [Nitriliruptorales bacterium]